MGGLDGAQAVARVRARRMMIRGMRASPIGFPVSGMITRSGAEVKMVGVYRI
jgi:hypothetical protein